MASNLGEKGPERVQLELIPESAAKSMSALYLEKANFGSSYPYTFFLGAGGDTNYVCGACGEVLAAEVERGKLRNLALKCFACGSVNALRGGI
ncbi:hypothetical protein LGM63_05475 [Burkholderia cepacia]|uniref:hypothetical protein n=1 Tax=Burkholderia cepacia TaxID=292 RepID=UPI000A5858E3|nr:hypothetical protein [Burkholderia cepacia]MCA7990082.1 hypothetical protein [Burkholderia cepacia]